MDRAIHKAEEQKVLPEPICCNLLEAAPHPYLILRPDPAFTIVGVNNKYLEATGTSRSEILGHGLFEIFPDDPGDNSTTSASDLQSSLQRVLQDRVPDIMGVQKYDIRDSGGKFEEKYWSPVNTPVFGKDGEIAFIIHHIQDVTEFVLAQRPVSSEQSIPSARVRNIAQQMEVMHRAAEVKEVNRKLKSMMKEMGKKNRELDEFAYVASHDLKEPLRGIHNYASFLREDYSENLDDQGKSYIQSINRLAERLTLLIDKLLAYSRLGRTELSRETVEINTVVDSAFEDMRSQMEEQGIEFRRDCRLPSIYGDPTLIGEVFQNLIGNAIKYNDKMVKTVEVGCDERSPQTVFWVRDNGIGIPPRHQEKVFHIFKRLHEQSKYGGGAGAGLTIVKKIIERHGGRIWLESTPGVGTTFYFTLSGEP